ncbi:MAG: magnesium transporter [Anaerosomatales bacterium]|nr:magnesium transporter [Anaerosomatales bacterium]MDT8434481.1 magnesium transporter [Anaerosomatales bacterium]
MHVETPTMEELREQVRFLVDEHDWLAVRRLLAEMSVPEVADLLEGVEMPERLLVFRLLPRDFSDDVFSYLDGPEQDVILGGLTDRETRRLLASMAPDDRTELFEELPGEITQKLLNLLDAGDLAEVRQLLGYPEESVGRLATTDYVAIRPQWTVAHALEHIRQRGRDSETIDVVYVTDRTWHLEGVCELRRLILAEPDHLVSDVMEPVHTRVTAFDDQEEAVREMQRHDTVALPVVDSAGVLIGIVTADDVFDVLEEEVTEDIHRTASVQPLRQSYRRLSVFDLYGKRIGWLAILLVVNLVSSQVISAYEETLMAAIALAFFIPLLIATGGNTGSQSAMMMVRALVTDDVGPGQWASTFVKELGVGLMLGVTLAGGSFFLGLFRGDWRIGVVVGSSMAAIVVVSNIIGMSLPFLFTKIGQDPTVASSPLITSLADVTGLLIYFGIARAVLQI